MVTERLRGFDTLPVPVPESEPLAVSLIVAITAVWF